MCCFYPPHAFLSALSFQHIYIPQNIFVYINTSISSHFYQRQFSSVVESWLHTQQTGVQYPALATIFCWGYTNRLSVSSSLFHMHKSEYLIKFASPFRSKPFSSQLWGKWSCGENGAVGKILTSQYKRQCWKWILVWPNLPLLLNNVR